MLRYIIWDWLTMDKFPALHFALRIKWYVINFTPICDLQKKVIYPWDFWEFFLYWDLRKDCWVIRSAYCSWNQCNLCLLIDMGEVVLLGGMPKEIEWTHSSLRECHFRPIRPHYLLLRSITVKWYSAKETGTTTTSKLCVNIDIWRIFFSISGLLAWTNNKKWFFKSSSKERTVQEVGQGKNFFEIEFIFEWKFSPLWCHKAFIAVIVIKM